jgi:1-acyl-sn-glycerol-3-phosphate acyltransferase
MNNDPALVRDEMRPADIGKPARVLLTGSSFAFFWSGGAVLSNIVLPLVGRGAPAAERRRRCREWVSWGFGVFHGYMRLMGLTDYDPRLVEIDLPVGPCVVIANHPTLIDVTAIVSALGDLAVVVKGEFWRSGVSRLLELCGHIRGGAGDERGGALEAASVAVQALERLRDGQAVLIFPEGTRSPREGLHPFQRGAFEIASRAGVPIVALFVTADPPWLMKHQRWYEVPDRMDSMRVRRLEAAPPATEGRSSRELAAAYEALYKERLDAWLRNRRRSGMVRH